MGLLLSSAKTRASGRTGRGGGGLRRFAMLAVLAGVCLGLSGCDKAHKKKFMFPVRIESTPAAGATVTLDGVPYGVTPLDIDALGKGAHELVLELDKYKTISQKIEVGAEGENVFVISMEPVVGYLTVRSEPSEAMVRLEDGTMLGKTPLIRHPLMVGDYTIEITKQDYHPRKETVSVKEYFQYDFREALEPMTAELKLFSRPTGASIWLNNILQTEKTPASFAIPPGFYLVRVHSEDFIEAEARIELAPNTSRELQLEMKPGHVPLGMALVAAGEFIWGEDNRAPDEAPRRKVFLKAFYIDKYEVTNADYKQVVPDFKYPKGRDDYPASGISWNEAGEYAKRVGKRLPTEAEWEKAARGTDGREYPWGMAFDPESANGETSSIGTTVSVSSYFKGVSPFGCMNMSGNVYEWTEDLYLIYPGNKVVTKEYGQSFRVLRGGSYTTAPFNMRCARRHFDHMDAKRADYGFRCALDAPP